MRVAPFVAERKADACERRIIGGFHDERHIVLPHQHVEPNELSSGSLDSFLAGVQRGMGCP